jgi:hypothetical protein
MTGSVLFLLVLIIILLGALLLNFSSTKQPTIQVLPSPVTVRGGDDRYTMAPRPERYDTGYTLPSLPTQGPPDRYTQVGVITGEDNHPLPLYGRRTLPRSDRFNYYTRTDTYNPVQLSIHYKKRDCQDGVGCEELMNGDEIRIGATGERARVTLYGF